MGPYDHRQSRILIIFPGALGDLICLLPAIHTIQARHPGTALELMARFELASFAVGRIPIARAHSIDRAEVAQLFAAPSGKMEDAQAFFGNFQAIYSFFAADNEQFRRRLTALVRNTSFYPFRPPGVDHVAADYLRSIGEFADASLAVHIDLLPDDVAAATALLARVGLNEHPFMLILPGSGSKAKNWPATNFVTLATRLAPQIRPLGVLGPAESDLIKLFRAAEIATLTDLDLGALAALAARARVFISNDSGVAHLAAAAGAPGVALFGPTDPQRWRPLGNVLTLCNKSIAKLTIDEVARAIGVCQS